MTKNIQGIEGYSRNEYGAYFTKISGRFECQQFLKILPKLPINKLPQYSVTPKSLNLIIS